MTGVDAVSITNQYSNPQVNSAKQKREKQEQVAAGVGGAAGLSSTTKMAGKRALSAEKTFQNLERTVQQTTSSINRSTKTANGLWSKFKLDIGRYSEDISRRLNGLRNSKIMKVLIDNPVSKKMIGFTGGVLAFFVFVSGVNNAVQTGGIAINDFKNQYNEFRSLNA